MAAVTVSSSAVLHPSGAPLDGRLTLTPRHWHSTSSTPQTVVSRHPAFADIAAGVVSLTVLADPGGTVYRVTVEDADGSPLFDGHAVLTDSDPAVDLAQILPSLCEDIATTVAPKGPKGDKGDPGTQGPAATITVASTTTGAPGTQAAVVNTGTPGAAALAFTIPRGDKGDPTQWDIVGTGPPEGRVTAPVGTRYTDQSATAGALLWAKGSGSGSSGWVVTHGDTGWRRISSWVGGVVTGAQFAPGWAPVGDGRLRIRRIGYLVRWELLNVVATVQSPGVLMENLSLLAFSPAAPAPANSVWIGAAFNNAFGIGVNGVGYARMPNGQIDNGLIIRQSVSDHMTVHPWPNTLPGIPD